jgi:hypothetical protein
VNTVACGMEDDRTNPHIDSEYGVYVESCESHGMEALSQYDWINKHVIKGWWIK